MGSGPAYVAHIPPLRVWYSRDSLCALCYGVAVGARMAYITTKIQKNASEATYLERARCVRLAVRSWEEGQIPRSRSLCLSAVCPLYSRRLIYSAARLGSIHSAKDVYHIPKPSCTCVSYNSIKP